MAQMIFNQDSRLNRMTGGEKRFAKILKSKLEDDYWCWFNIPLGARRCYPDFIILHPRRGLLILEVKDWRLNTIQRCDKHQATLLTSGGLKNTANPLEQARQNMLVAVNLLVQDAALQHPKGHQHQGKLCFPYGYGAVLANITRARFDSTDLAEAIAPDLLICQDEMTESVDEEEFQTRLWNMFPGYFSGVLSMPQIDRIRAYIFPEIVVRQGELFPAESENTDTKTEATAPLPDLLYVMDLEQEKLARRLGDGHRIIHGVAGSGKTMILGYRCLHLARELNKPILVLCYNIALAAKLRAYIQHKGIAGQISIRHFHGWCQDQLKMYHVPNPAPGSPAPGDNYFERLVMQVIDAAERGQIPKGQYGAVLIDEAHDFELSWLQLIAQMVDPDTNSLLVLYDNAQSIYSKRGNGLQFNLSEAGIQARGRTKVLKINYRNTAEVLAVACEFAREVFTEDKDEIIPVVQPESLRHGALPELVKLPTFSAEADYIADQLHQLNENGLPWNDMAVLYRDRRRGEILEQRLNKAGIPIEWLNRNRGSRHYRPDQSSVKVMTMHSSKGLEFPVVAVAGLGFMPYHNADPKDEARLLYVAMTRAMDTLLMTYHQDSEFARRIHQARQRIVV